MKVNNDNLQKSIAHEMMGETDYDKRKKEVIKKIGDNPIAKKIEDNLVRVEKMDERFEEWESVQCLISATRDLYMDNGDLKKTVGYLTDALDKLINGKDK